ncbi:MAG: hypothetical protein ABI904_12865 [Chloroflexota bacterium]
MKTRENERRDSGIIILLILLLGFICIFLTSGWALRFAPSWKLDSNMESNLNPNSDFLTSRPVSFFEPLDPAILTNPIWQNVFLTPGASIQIRTPSPANPPTSVPSKTSTPVPATATVMASPTNTLIVIVYPTNTKVYIPPTSTPNPLPTNTPVTPLPPADLQITKNDGVITYTPGGASLLYIITVTNNGPNAVNGAVVTDNIPAQLTTWDWVCFSQTGGATGCDGVTGSNANFTDTVNLPNGASIVYTVTANISAVATGNLTNTANVNVPTGYTDPTLGNNTASDVDTFVPLSADLQITKTDGVAIYTPGGTLTYTITVTNNGINAVTGAVVADNIPAQITTWDWVCFSQTGGANGCDGVTGSNTNFTDTVNLPNGASIVYTVTANISAVATGNLINTASVSVPVGYTDPTPGNNSVTDTDTSVLIADLGITKTDNSADYVPSSTKTYTIVVSNAGPSDVVGATVNDMFSTNANVASASWTCLTMGSATCTTGSGDVNDVVNMSVGSTITYTVTATIVGLPSGNLTNTASVGIPAGTIDPVPGNNSATDTDTLIVTNPVPPNVQIGTPPDGVPYTLPTGSTLTLPLNIVVNGHASYDLVYYEFVNPPGIFMDQVLIEISDGSNWYTILNWGDGNPDTNTNISVPLLPPNPTTCAGELDNCVIDASLLLGGTGIEIQLDGVVPNGTFSYIRFTAPLGDSGDGMEIDAIGILP